MAERSTPNAPLSHGDEEAHRRLIAARANAIGYEEGEWTPTYDFSTTGDLSNSYANQYGKYWRFGPLLHFIMQINVTPTFTTAAGHLQIHGLPYVKEVGFLATQVYEAQYSSSGLAYPAGETDLFAFHDAGNDYLRIATQGTATGASIIGASHITSGVATNTIRVAGFYPIA